MNRDGPKSWLSPIPVVGDPIFLDLREETLDEMILLHEALHRSTLNATAQR